MDKGDSGAVDAMSTALEALECIGPLVNVPNLQVMSPTVGISLVPLETMADMLDDKDLRRKSSKKPIRTDANNNSSRSCRSVSSAQKQAYNVNSAKDEKKAEHEMCKKILLIDQLQLKIQNLHLRMQAFQEHQVQWQQNEKATAAPASASSPQYQVRKSGHSPELQKVKDENIQQYAEREEQADIYIDNKIDEFACGEESSAHPEESPNEVNEDEVPRPLQGSELEEFQSPTAYDKENEPRTRQGAPEKEHEVPQDMDPVHEILIEKKKQKRGSRATTAGDIPNCPTNG